MHLCLNRVVPPPGLGNRVCALTAGLHFGSHSSPARQRRGLRRWLAREDHASNSKKQKGPSISSGELASSSSSVVLEAVTTTAAATLQEVATLAMAEAEKCMKDYFDRLC